MEKRFALLAAIGSFVILSLAIVLVLIYTGSPRICTKLECVKSANEFIMYMNEGTDPCNDFYEFSCGNIIGPLNTELFDNAEESMRYTKRRNVQLMMDEPITLNDNEPSMKMKSFYQACINESVAEFEGLKGIKRILEDMGGWPTIQGQGWNEHYSDWRNATYYLRSIGADFQAFIGLNIRVNGHDTTKHIIQITNTADELADIPDSSKKNLYDYMMDVALHFGAERRSAERDSKEVIEFLSQLKRIRNEESVLDNKQPVLYNQRILSQIQYDFPSISWVDYVNGVLYPSSSVTSDDAVSMENPNYIKRILRLLNATPKRIIANFFSWYVIRLYTPFLPKALREFEMTLQAKSGLYKMLPREDTCASITAAKMREIVEASYVRKYVSEAALRLTKGIIDYIKKELNKIIDNLDWLDGDAKEVAREKLASTKDYIAYTQEAPTRSKLDLIYDEVVINQESFLGTVQHIDFINLNLKYRQLTEAVHEYLETDEIFYSVKENTLALPSYYLQGLFFDENRPHYMNYGALGTVIARQLSNLVLEGRSYDVYGNLKQWSTSQSLLNYDTRAKCVTEQYREFYSTPDRKGKNATENIDEDLSIMMGKYIAYEAYNNWANKHDTEFQLPGLKYSPKQLFWISSVLYECSREEIDAHFKEKSSARLRVIGPLRNSQAFARDFKCPSKSYMNEDEKCLLWNSQ